MGLAKRRQAAALAARAERIGRGGIASDDPEAITRLGRKLEALTETRDGLKAEAAAYRKARNAEAKTRATAWAITPKEAQRVIETADWRLKDGVRRGSMQDPD